MTTTQSPAKMTTSFTSVDFERSHGRKPSGRGGWVFEAVFSNDDGEGEAEMVFTPGAMTTGEAKKWARTWAVENRPEVATHCHFDFQG